jgi:dienelactone hydrolase
MSCCPPGSFPALQAPADYIPQGERLELNNSLPVYRVGNSSSSKCLLVFPEVFGWEGRLKGFIPEDFILFYLFHLIEICDTFANQGYFVLMPDIMRGETLAKYAHDPNLKDNFLTQWSTWENLEQDIQTLFAYVDGLGIQTIGTLGFCWGIWLGFKASAAGFPIIAGAGAHPSIRLEEYHGRTPEQLAELVNCPMMLASARNDPPNVQEGGAIEQILKSRFPLSEIKSFTEVDHGWVTRGSLEDPIISQSASEAIEKLSAFLSRALTEAESFA